MTCLDSYLRVVSSDPSRLRPMPVATLSSARAALLGYLFHALTYADLKMRLTRMGVDIRPRWRARLVSDPKVIRDLKFAIYQAVCCESFPHDVSAVIDKALACGLATEDIPLVKLACQHSRLSAHLCELAESYPALEHKRFNALVTAVVARTRRNIQRFAAAKMQFLEKRGHTLDHSTADCISLAYEAMLFQYPCIQNDAHAENLFKRTARQQGLKVISRYSAGTRSAYHPRVDGEPQVCRVSYLEDYNDYDDEIDEAFDTAYTEMSAEVSELPLQLYQLMRSRYLSADDKRFLQLAAGLRDPEFDVWLVEQTGLDVDAHVEHTRRHGRLIRMAMDYLQYPSRRLNRMRGLLTGDYRLAPVPNVRVRPALR